MNDETLKTLVITGASVIVGYTLKQLAQKKWKDVYDEEPPATHPSENQLEKGYTLECNNRYGH